jgi:ATP-dependent Clp protease ATP-binding subunit ClpB
VLDDGRLTDGQGRTVNFKNTVIILTSNIGSQHIQSIGERDIPSEDKKELIQRAVTDDVRKSFRPEFLNRLDEMVVFNLLDRRDIHAIIDIQLRRFQDRLAKREIFVELTAAAKDVLAEVGWDPQYGARPLKRAIQRYLEDPLAKHVLAGEYPPGTQLRVDRGADGQLTFSQNMAN